MLVLLRVTAMKFSELARYLDQLEATSSRNEMVRILSELYRACSVAEIERLTYQILGRPALFFIPMPRGKGERLIISAIATAYKTPKKEVRKLYRQIRAVGATAQRIAPKDGHGAPPSVVDVHQRLRE